MTALSRKAPSLVASSSPALYNICNCNSIMHAGIDPGANGGIAILSKTSKLIAVHDMPKMKHDGKTISDPVGILEILKGVKSITLEEVGSRPPASPACSRLECPRASSSPAPAFWISPFKWCAPGLARILQAQDRRDRLRASKSNLSLF